MSIRRTVEIEAPPAKALAALATAGENLEYTVRRIDRELGLALLASPWTREAASFGYILTGVVTSVEPPVVTLQVEVTPRMGFWALKGSAEQADEVLEELERVLQAPKARIRAPQQAGQKDRPFGYRPEVAGALWAVGSLVVYGLGVGGGWWGPAGAGLLGGLLLAVPSRSSLWTVAIIVLGVASIPFGLLGLSFRREALAQSLWRNAKAPHSDL